MNSGEAAQENVPLPTIIIYGKRKCEKSLLSKCINERFEKDFPQFNFDCRPKNIDPLQHLYKLIEYKRQSKDMFEKAIESYSPSPSPRCALIMVDDLPTHVEIDHILPFIAKLF